MQCSLSAVLFQQASLAPSACSCGSCRSMLKVRCLQHPLTSISQPELLIQSFWTQLEVAEGSFHLAETEANLLLSAGCRHPCYLLEPARGDTITCFLLLRYLSPSKGGCCKTSARPICSHTMLSQRWTCRAPREHGFYATRHKVQSLRCCVPQGGCPTLSEFLEEEALLACLANPRKPLKPRETLRRDVKSPARTKTGWPAHMPAPLRHPLSLRNAGHVSCQPHRGNSVASCRMLVPEEHDLYATWRKMQSLRCCVPTLSEFLEEEAILACLANPRKPLKPRETLRRDVKSPARTKTGWPAHMPAPLRHPLSFAMLGTCHVNPTEANLLLRAACWSLKNMTSTQHGAKCRACCVPTLSEFLEEEAILACLANPRKPLKPRETLRRDVKSPARTKKGWPAHTPAPLRHPLSLRNAGHVSRQPMFLRFSELHLQSHARM